MNRKDNRTKSELRYQLHHCKRRYSDMSDRYWKIREWQAQLMTGAATLGGVTDDQAREAGQLLEDLSTDRLLETQLRDNAKLRSGS